MTSAGWRRALIGADWWRRWVGAAALVVAAGLVVGACLWLERGGGGGGSPAGEAVAGGHGDAARAAGTPLAGAPSNRGAAEALAALRVKLPFRKGERYEVFQGNLGSFSHSGLNSYAWDFGMPEGTQVVAAAEGRVVRVKQDSARGGTAAGDFADGNAVVLDHGHGLFSQYLHLRRDGVLAREGDVVKGGQVIALSGSTGFSSVPHLHFQVQDAMGQSLAARFADVAGDGVPRTGQVVASGNDGTGTSAYGGESTLPLDAFAGNGVELRGRELPAGLLSATKPYHLSGSVGSDGARQVVAYLMGPQGGRPVLAAYATIDASRRFELELDFAALPDTVPRWSWDLSQSNIFTLAITTVQPDGSYWSRFSVPVSVR